MRARVLFLGWWGVGRQRDHSFEYSRPQLFKDEEDSCEQETPPLLILFSFFWLQMIILTEDLTLLSAYLLSSLSRILDWLLIFWDLNFVNCH